MPMRDADSTSALELKWPLTDCSIVEIAPLTWAAAYVRGSDGTTHKHPWRSWRSRRPWWQKRRLNVPARGQVFGPEAVALARAVAEADLRADEGTEELGEDIAAKDQHH